MAYGLPAFNVRMATLALLFIAVSHPMTYGLTNSLLGGIIGPLASPSGAPTTVGIVVHSIVFVLLKKSLL